MNRNSTDEKEITLVIKDKKNVGHEFLIKPDLTVVYDGSVLRLEVILVCMTAGEGREKTRSL